MARGLAKIMANCCALINLKQASVGLKGVRGRLLATFRVPWIASPKCRVRGEAPHWVIQCKIDAKIEMNGPTKRRISVAINEDR